MEKNYQKCDESLINYVETKGDNHEKVKLLIQFNEDHEAKVQNFLLDCGCNFQKQFSNINTYLIETSLDYLNELNNHDSIIRINLDRPAWLLLDTAVPSTGVNKVDRKLNPQSLTGKGINVAIIDTGVHPHEDLITPNNRIVAFKDLVNHKIEPYDDNGHGTHVAGCVASNGLSSDGIFEGTAPEANIIAIKTMDGRGRGTISNIIEGIEWVIDNKNTYNIHILSLSLGTSPLRSYKEDPLCQALEKAWEMGIVVLVAAGNEGPKSSTIGSPAIHPQLITIGATDDMNTVENNDDVIANFSSRGPTKDGFNKPDLVAPGSNIISLRSPGSYSDIISPKNRVNEYYFNMSGTSMATPISAGLVALLLEQDNQLSPNEIKKLLIEGAIDISDDKNAAGYGIVNFQNSLNVLNKYKNKCL
ncbi:S8 family peptidase [Niallia sp. Sow4_A1]|uniref:S8 family peptidase n=1 Tax=unclassified Niallia TaxID=2837522 RepID=UPI00203D142A|nr:S8 family peptidase [Niallia sp. MER TA 168]MCM3364907.1 S8 family peptidase [Niallia sp. MER TA 168]